MSAITNLKHEHGDPLRIVIKTDGTVQVLTKPEPLVHLQNRMGANTMDTVILADARHVMLVDDAGHHKMSPINALATRLYHERCRPGTTHQIRGTVIVCPDEDFAGIL